MKTLLSRCGLASGLLLVASTMLHATSYNIDFSTLPGGMTISNQYASQGVTFSVDGGPNGSGSPAIGIEFGGGLSNSTSGNYPTSEFLEMDFANGASDVSFTFNNYGSDPGTTYTAYSGATIVDSGNLSGDCCAFSPQSVAGSDVTSLVIDNYYGSFGYSWEFVVGDLSYTTSPTPEPDSLLLLGTGLLGMSGMAYRKLRSSVGI